jgi:hypothetical protein
MGCEGCEAMDRRNCEESPTGVPPVLVLSLERWEETPWVHDTDDYVFVEGFLPHL